MSEAVFDAIKAGDVDRLAELLAGGADPNTSIKKRSGSGVSVTTALEVAVYKLWSASELEPGGPIDAVVLLLRYGAAVDGLDAPPILTPLLAAVTMPHLEAVRILLAAGADPNLRNDEGDSPLRMCALRGYLEMARLLLHSGADKAIDEAGGCDSAGRNALGCAATRLHVDMVRLLLAHGANPWVEDNDRMTVFDRLGYISLPEDPLARERYQQICQLLRDVKPMDPSPIAPDGERSNGRGTHVKVPGAFTPEALLEAIRARDVDRLAELLAAGADPNKPLTRHGLTPLQAAVDELEALSENEPGGPIDAVVLLLRHGAAVNSWDERRTSTPLLTAVQINHIEAVRILLAAGADPNVRDNEGNSPLRLCADKGLLEMARLLLHCGAGKTIDEGGGSTGMNALGFAATSLNVEMVRLLLAHGANPQAWDLDKRTPLDRLRKALPQDLDAQERLREIRRLLGDPSA
jgi:ankyrin repeat protein